MCAPRRALPAVLALLAAACGGGGPAGPPPPLELHDVVAVVFYDENGNGVLDAGEGTRLPDVEVQIGDRTARSERLTGRAVVTGVPDGTWAVAVRPRTLPPFYRPGAEVVVRVPQPAGQDVMVPALLPIGSNQPNTYMAFGDSITLGDGSSDGEGYRSYLQADLDSYFDQGTIINQGVEGTRSTQGADRIRGSLSAVRPAYTLVHYGTNDWNDFRCKQSFPCYTLESLRVIVRAIRAAHSLPVLATIIPANPAFPRQVPPERNSWVHQEDDSIRGFAKEEGAVLADLEAAFLKEGDLTRLFADHVHPNDRGYEIMATEFSRAITDPAGEPGARSLVESPAFGFVAPAGPGPRPPGAGGREKPRGAPARRPARERGSRGA